MRVLTLSMGVFAMPALCLFWGAGEEDALMRASRDLLAGDRLGGLASRQVRMRPTTREREEVEAARVQFASPHTDHLSQRAGKLSEQARSRGFEPLFGEVHGEDEHDRLSVRSEESETGSETWQTGQHASDNVAGYVDVTTISAASRRSAAPHIYNIFEQIFVDSDAARQRPSIPNLPDAVRASMRASGINLEQELGLTGKRAEVVMTIDESWLNLTGGTGAANGLQKQLVADLAIALRIDKSRIQVTSVRPEGGGVRALAELLILPGAEDEPAAVEVAEALSMQAGTPKSMLHAMNSTRRAGDVRFREVQPAVLRGMQGGPYQALLRGGVVVDDRGVRPTLSAVHGVTSMQLKQNAVGLRDRGSGGYQGYTGVNDEQSVESARHHQERDQHAMQMVEAARRHQEGFWVDVDRGVFQQVQTNKEYGTFHQPKQKKVFLNTRILHLCALDSSICLLRTQFPASVIFHSTPMPLPISCISSTLSLQKKAPSRTHSLSASDVRGFVFGRGLLGVHLIFLAPKAVVVGQTRAVGATMWCEDLKLATAVWIQVQSHLI